MACVPSAQFVLLCVTETCCCTCSQYLNWLCALKPKTCCAQLCNFTGSAWAGNKVVNTRVCMTQTEFHVFVVDLCISCFQWWAVVSMTHKCPTGCWILQIPLLVTRIFSISTLGCLEHYLPLVLERLVEKLFAVSQLNPIKCTLMDLNGKLWTDLFILDFFFCLSL